LLLNKWSKFTIKAAFMSVNDYKELIKSLVDSTNNELLLKHWKRQLEWDIQHQGEVELTQEEMNLVQEGITEYSNGEVLSLEEFINKRK
jgi:hypothetical protein